MLSKRETDIIQFILMNRETTIARIASHMNLSDKTISESLKIIHSFFEDKNIQLVRKPKVGISIIGDEEIILNVLSEGSATGVPNTREERVQYLCFEILKKETYFTRTQLQDALFVSMSTLENDMNLVKEIFHSFNVTIEWIPGKGSFLNLSEQEKRRLAFDLVYYFWGSNFKVSKKGSQYLHSIRGIPKYAEDFVNKEKLAQIDLLLQSFLKETGIHFSDVSYNSLLLHLLIMINRIQEKNYVAPESREGIIQTKAFIHPFIHALEEKFSVQLMPEEVHFLTIYFETEKGNAFQGTKNQVDDDLIHQLIQKSVKIKDDEAILGFVIHVKEAIERIRRGLLIHNPFLHDVKKNFPLSFEEGMNLAWELDTHFDIETPEEEIAFLAVHIQANKEKQKESEEKFVRALLVCSSGKGTSQLLAARIRREYENIKISRILSVQELMNTSIHEDLILTTIDLKGAEVPTLLVSPVLSKQDKEKIEHFLSVPQNKSKTTNRLFSQLIHPEFIFLDVEFENYKQVLQFIGDELSTRGYAKKEIVQSSQEREALSFTSFEKFATPHGNPEYVEQSVIAFLRLRNEIQWGETRVKYVFFICMKDKTPQELETIYDSLLNRIESKQSKMLLKSKKQGIVQYLKEGK